MFPVARFSILCVSYGEKFMFLVQESCFLHLLFVRKAYFLHVCFALKSLIWWKPCILVPCPEKCPGFVVLRADDSNGFPVCSSAEDLPSYVRCSESHLFFSPVLLVLNLLLCCRVICAERFLYSCAKKFCCTVTRAENLMCSCAKNLLLYLARDPFACSCTCVCRREWCEWQAFTSQHCYASLQRPVEYTEVNILVKLRIIVINHGSGFRI